MHILMGKPGRAWVGAWVVVHGSMHGWWCMGAWGGGDVGDVMVGVDINVVLYKLEVVGWYQLRDCL